MLLAHKIRLIPTPADEMYFARACGVARFAWNWSLATWQTMYAAWKLDPTQPKPSAYTVRKQLNAIKREQFPWMLEVTKCAAETAVLNLGTAYQNWFSSLSGKRRGPKVSAPTFKKKHRGRDSFKVDGMFIQLDGPRIRVPNLGWVRMRESVRFSGKVVSVTISRAAHAWFASVLVETNDVPPRSENQASVGVDVGIKALATFSDGRVVEGPKALTTLLQRLRRLSRAHSRKVKGSNNRRKSARCLARLHWRIANVRNDALHKLSHHLTTEYGFIAIEDLNVAGMLKNGRLARHIADAGFGELRRQLEYKAAQRGVQLEVVNRWYPSSKTCSDCGSINEVLTLSDRFWVCMACGSTHDRDSNAAKNILAEAIRQVNITTPGAGVTVCESSATE
ncbi:RNA-guided endonuclease TnpB family protein [Burkholderia multivorans]|nr:RNA-guided endonuclease TnpB family protein [Burkholderia multivorans]